MGDKQAGATICFVIGIFGLVRGVFLAVSNSALHAGEADAVGQTVGSFLVPILLFIVGLKLWGSKPPVPDEEGPPPEEKLE